AGLFPGAREPHPHPPPFWGRGVARPAGKTPETPPVGGPCPPAPPSRLGRPSSDAPPGRGREGRANLEIEIEHPIERSSKSDRSVWRRSPGPPARRPPTVVGVVGMSGEVPISFVVSMRGGGCCLCAVAFGTRPHGKIDGIGITRNRALPSGQRIGSRGSELPLPPVGSLALPLASISPAPLPALSNSSALSKPSSSIL